ncbi:hypothetical protein BMS3Bbin04_00676 [bacterium BMS3Bbin04]|nr:hypothetical protein BMS3Bbin04_00676 [bacterium BMS3Bbin04]
MPGPDGFDALVFRHGMYGSGADIPLTWYGRYGDGIVVDDNEPWMLMIHNPCGGMGWCIRKCDHWFQFKGVFDLPYHIDDGYYSLEISGCPTPGL